MGDERQFDGKVGGLVRAVDERVPPAVDRKIRTAAETLRPRPWLFAGRWPRVLALVPGAAAFAVAVFLVVPALRKPPASRISEIRTEFEIADKNIKIVFFQRPDFKLTQEE